jgi:hypothetical protein
MVSADHDAAIVKMLLKPFALVARFLKLAANMRSQFKSLMESGAVYLKMIASQFSTASAQLRYRLQVNYLFSPENKKPAETSAGFLVSN